MRTGRWIPLPWFSQESDDCVWHVKRAHLVASTIAKPLVEVMCLRERRFQITRHAGLIGHIQHGNQQVLADPRALKLRFDPDEGQVPMRLIRVVTFKYSEAVEQPRGREWKQCAHDVLCSISARSGSSIRLRCVRRKPRSDADERTLMTRSMYLIGRQHLVKDGCEERGKSDSATCGISEVMREVGPMQRPEPAIDSPRRPRRPPGNPDPRSRSYHRPAPLHRGTDEYARNCGRCYPKACPLMPQRRAVLPR